MLCCDLLTYAHPFKYKVGMIFVYGNSDEEAMMAAAQHRIYQWRILLRLVYGRLTPLCSVAKRSYGDGKQIAATKKRQSQGKGKASS